MSILAAASVEELQHKLIYRYSFLTPNSGECNSLGFRSSELNSDADICYYGCSWSYGVGVSIDHRWTNIIDKHQNYVSNNFGVCGIGIDELVTIFIATTKFVKMKTALFLLPDISRQTIPFYNRDQNKLHYKNMFPNLQNVDNPYELSIAKAWFTLPNLYYEDTAKTSIDLILHIANLNNIKVYFSGWQQMTFDLLPTDKRTKNYHPSDKLGSDNLHPGPQVHKNIADEFMELL
jgi:hypothetical protein